MKPQGKQSLVAWGYACATLVLALTLIIGASSGTAFGQQQGTPTATPIPTTDTGQNLDEAQRLLDLAQREANRHADIDVEAVILLSLYSLQAGYLPAADFLLSSMVDRLAKVEMIYSDPREGFQETHSLAVSPDGQRIVSAENDGNLRVYDVETGHLVYTWLVTLQRVMTIAYSPNGDLIAVGAEVNKFLLLDSTTGRITTFIELIEGNVNDVDFNADGSLVAFVTAAGEIKVVDPVKGAVVHEYHDDANLLNVKFSPDGQSLLVTDDNHHVRLWDVADGQVLFDTTLDDSGNITAVFTTDGQAIVADGSGQLVVLDAVTGEVVQTITVQLSGLLHMALSPDGRYLLVGASGTARAILYDTSTWEITQVYIGNGNTISAVAFSPDGQDVFLGMSEAEIHRDGVYRVYTPGSYPAHTAPIVALDYSPDGQTFMTATDAGLVKIWDTNDYHLITSFRTTEEDLPYLQGLTAGFVDANTIWTANTDLGMKVWDIQTGTVKFNIEIPWREGLNSPSIVATSGDGLVGAVALYSDEVFLFDLTTGESLGTVRQNNGMAVGLEFSEDDTRLAVIGSDERVRIYDIATGRVIKVLGPFGNQVKAIAFSPDASQLLIGTYGEVRLVDIDSDRALRVFPVGSAEYPKLAIFAQFTADTTRVLGLSANGVVQIWDVETGNLVRLFGTFTYDITLARFTPDQSQIVTGADDGSVRVWPLDMDTTVAQACSMLTHDFSAKLLEHYGISNGEHPCPELTAPSEESPQPTQTPLPTTSPS